MKQEVLSVVLEYLEQASYLANCIFSNLECSDREAAVTGISMLMDTIDKIKDLLTQNISQGENNDIQ